MNEVWAPDFGDLTVESVIYPVADADFIGHAAINGQGLAGNVGNSSGEIAFYVTV